jgi:hypothetical protein
MDPKLEKEVAANTLGHAKSDYESAVNKYQSALGALAGARAELGEAEQVYSAAGLRRSAAQTEEGKAVARLRTATESLGQMLARRLDAEQAVVIGRRALDSASVLKEGLSR